MRKGFNSLPVATNPRAGVCLDLILTKMGIIILPYVLVFIPTNYGLDYDIAELLSCNPLELIPP